MRPSSSSTPNAPDRAKQPVLIDFFAKEEAEQQVRNAIMSQQSLLAELSSKRATPSHRLDGNAETSTSADSHITIDSLRRFIGLKGYSTGEHMYDKTIQSRLDIVNLSAKTLLAALEIIDTPHHQLLETIRLKDIERYSLFSKLVGIVNQSGGFTKQIRVAAQRANNNPEQLIVNFLALVR